MRKKKTKKLLVSIFAVLVLLILYFCSPFLLNFNDKKRTGIENILSDLIFYQINIKGGIKYKLTPLPILEISEIHIQKENENSILNKVIIRTSIFDLIQNRFSYKDVTLEGGEFIVDLNNLKHVSFIEEFKQKKIFLRDVSLRFFNNKQSFNLDKINAKIYFEDSLIKKVKGQFNLGEIKFKTKYDNNKLNLKSNEIDLKISVNNLLNKQKNIKINFNNQSMLPGVNRLYASFNYEQINDGFSFESQKFETNLSNGFIKISKLKKTNNIVIEGFFKDVNFKKIKNSDLKDFFQNRLNELSNIIDAEIILNFENIKTKNNLFNKAQFKVNFQKGDVVFENISLLSNENKFSIQGRNINYQKDNLLFYELAFETKDLKKICEKVCNDQDIVDKIIHNKINIKSKGILNLNKAKISVQENFFKKFFNENELKKLNTNLNTLIIFGKLENIFELSRYFVLL